MGYSKIIISGNSLEVYEYEKDIIKLLGRSTRNRTITPDISVLGTNGENTLPKRDSERTLGKRRDNAQHPPSTQSESRVERIAVQRRVEEEDLQPAGNGHGFHGA